MANLNAPQRAALLGCAATIAVVQFADIQDNGVSGVGWVVAFVVAAALAWLGLGGRRAGRSPWKTPPTQEELSAAITKHLAEMREAGATGNPSDYVDDLEYTPPDKAFPSKPTPFTCVCCCALFVLELRKSGMWSSTSKKTGEVAPVCAFCVLWLNRKAGNAAPRAQPPYDTVGQQLARSFPGKSPVEAAVVRALVLEKRLASP